MIGAKFGDRNARPEELERIAAIERDAFVIDHDAMPRFIENFLKPNLDNFRVLEEDGNVVSVLRLLYPELWFGAGRVPMEVSVALQLLQSIVVTVI